MTMMDGLEFLALFELLEHCLAGTVTFTLYCTSKGLAFTPGFFSLNIQYWEDLACGHDVYIAKARIRK